MPGQYGQLNSAPPISQTKKDIKETFRKWPEVQGYDIRLGLRDAEVLFTVNGSPTRLPCDRFDDAGLNLRACYLILDATRKAAQRGILAELVAVATALLPAGAPPAHEVLGISADADIDVAEAVFKAKAKRAHPDRAGGTHEAMKDLNNAIDWFRARPK